MNIKTYLIITAACLPLALRAQTIDFETTDGYTAIGVYDTWEASPFRTGKLEGNAAVIPNPFREASPQATAPANPTTKVLAVQRSRFGSNTFGVRIDLKVGVEIRFAMQSGQAEDELQNENHAAENGEKQVNIAAVGKKFTDVFDHQFPLHSLKVECTPLHLHLE